MSEYTPPNALNVILNFTKDLEQVNAHNLILDFGAEDQEQVLAQVDAVLNLAVFFEASARQSKVAIIDAQFNTAIQFDAHVARVALAQIDSEMNTGIQISIDAEAIYQFAQIDSVLNTAILFESITAKGQLSTIDCSVSTSAIFECFADIDINHIVGISKGISSVFKKALACCAQNVVPWHKPIVMALDCAIYYESGLIVSKNSSFQSEKALSLSDSIKLHFEKTTGLVADVTLIFDQSLTLKKSKLFAFDESNHLAVNRSFDYDEMLKRRRGYTMSHQVAEQFTNTFSFSWDLGLETITQDIVRYEDADQIHYQKHPVQPWPKPKPVIYEGNTDLNFNCLCTNIDAHNVVLNFGEDDCIPQRTTQNWWYILNNISVSRLDNHADITVIDGTYETSRDRWCWVYSLTLAPDQLHKLESTDNTPVVLKIMVNGFEHHMLVEGEPEETRRFAQTLFKLNGRSVTALDSETYSAKRSFLQENERRAEQLCQAELDRVFSDTQIDWQLLEETGWVVPTQSLTYTNLAPMDAIKLVVESAGGFIYSQKAFKTLSILPRYKKSYWNAMQIEDYDLILDESLMLQHDIKHFDTQFDYNSIMMINSLSGNTARVGIVDTAKDTPLPTESSALFTTVSMGGYAKTALSKANIRECHTFGQMPVSQEIGEMIPGKTLAFGGEWWGVIDSVKGSFNHREVWETVEVERVSRE